MLLILFIGFCLLLIYRFSPVVRTTPSAAGQVLEGLKEWAQSWKKRGKGHYKGCTKFQLSLVWHLNYTKENPRPFSFLAWKFWL